MGEEKVVLCTMMGLCAPRQQEQCLGLEFPENARLSSVLLTIY